MKKKTIIIIFWILIICVLGIIIFIKKQNNTYKILNVGNNSNENITLDEIEKMLLNINYYEATIEVTVKSNKNTNKYLMKQVHCAEQDIQTIIEPSDLEGVEMIYRDNKLEVKNSKLNISKIYSDYPYIDDNVLWLNSFLKDYKNVNPKIKEEKNEFIIEIESQKIKKRLYIEKNSKNISKLEITDANKNDRVYILYNEITLK